MEAKPNYFENNEEYIFIEDINELFRCKNATTTSWAFKFFEKSKADSNSFLIIAMIGTNIHTMAFNKSDLKCFKKLYQLIRIYYGIKYVNLITHKNEEGKNILEKIYNQKNLKLFIMKKLNIDNQFSLNKFDIIEVIREGFDKVYMLEYKNNNFDSSKGKMKQVTSLEYNNRYSRLTQQMVQESLENNININLNNYIYINNNDNIGNDNNVNKKIFNNNMPLTNNINNKAFPNNNHMNQLDWFSQKNLADPKFNNNILWNNNNPKLMQNNIINNFQNNNQMNNEPKINYDEEIENNANKYFKYIFFEGFEKDYFSQKGLNNVGLTCYMNSTLQCLIHIPELSHYFFNLYNEFCLTYDKIIKKTETKGKISKEYYNIVKEILSSSYDRFNRYSFSPKTFNDVISKLNPQFSKYESNDAKDLIIYLLQEMHEELNYFGDNHLVKIPKCNQLIENDAFKFFYEVNSKMNFSIISYLFWGIVKQTTVCQVCKNNLYNFQYYQYLSFPLYKYSGDNFNLYKGLKDYISVEILQGENQFYCQNCGCLRDAKIFSKIYYCSPYLLINFDYGKNKSYNPKKIDFGSIICLTNEFLENKTQVDYELIAVSTHLGSSGNAGHYITYCKNINTENSWYKFNDSSVSKSDFEETKKNSPYLLLFRKRNK